MKKLGALTLMLAATILPMQAALAAPKWVTCTVQTEAKLGDKAWTPTKPETTIYVVDDELHRFFIYNAEQRKLVDLRDTQFDLGSVKRRTRDDHGGGSYTNETMDIDRKTGRIESQILDVPPSKNSDIYQARGSGTCKTMQQPQPLADPYPPQAQGF